MKAFLLFLITVLMFSVYSMAQPFTKKYIMSIGMCDTNCTNPTNKLVNLLESDDGVIWTVVPGFTPYSGSVPDVITRGNELYIYTPTPPSGWVKRYYLNTNTWDASTVPVTIRDSANNVISWVDPSAIIDGFGNIVLFFMNTTGLTDDPALCTSYPCTKYFESAIEVAGSDGTQFIKTSGHRAAITLQDTIDKCASDPDIFYDGTNYNLYITKANGMLAYHCNQLHGSYTPYSGLPNGFLSN